MWHAFVDVIRATIFSAAHLCGGSLGGGILLTSMVVRLALLPLTLRMARRARDQQRRLAAIAGDARRIQEQFAREPLRQLQETRRLHEQHGIRAFTPSTILMMVVQAPLLAGLFGAVRSGVGQRIRFAWIADLARSNGTLVMLVAALSACSAMLLPAPSARPAQTSLSVLIVAVSTVAFLWSASSAVALSWGSGAVMTLLQNVLIARDERRSRATP